MDHCDSSTQEAEAGGWQLQSQSGLHSKAGLLKLNRRGDASKTLGREHNSEFHQTQRNSATEVWQRCPRLHNGGKDNGDKGPLGGWGPDGKAHGGSGTFWLLLACQAWVLQSGLEAHLGSSAGRHSTEWYKPFTATSHSRSMAEVLSVL